MVEMSWYQSGITILSLFLFLPEFTISRRTYNPNKNYQNLQYARDARPNSTNTTIGQANTINISRPPENPPPLPKNQSNNTSLYATKPLGHNNSLSTNSNGSNGLAGVRIRLNEPLFAETARLFQSIFGYQVQSIQIGSYQQCFQEGCFFLHSFKITGYQKPRAITLRPMQPNKLLLNIFAFDVDIIGSISGNLQILLNVPIAGQIVANARQISISASFDLQKDQQRVPYLRTESCALRTGYVNAQVLGMGLITDSVNIKYKKEMIEKARDIISLTICSNIERTIRDQVNQRFKDMPKHISIFELFQYLDHSAPEVHPRPIVARDPHSVHHYRTQPEQLEREKRRAEMHGVGTVVEIVGDDIKARSESRPFHKHSKKQSKLRQDTNDIDSNNEIAEDEMPDEETDNISTTETSTPSSSSTTKKIGANRNSGMDGWKNFSMRAIVPSTNRVSQIMDVNGLRAFLDTIDVNSLARLFVNLDFLDSISNEDSFIVGMDGTILLNASPYTGTYGDPPTTEEAEKLQFPNVKEHKTLEVVVGEYTPNSMLQQAHRAKILRFHIRNNTPLFGKMLKTSCSPDEICISDSIPEIGEKYPNKYLDIIVESIRPPRFIIGEDEFRIMMIGLATFYLTEARQAIGKIPFSTIVKVGVRSIDQVLHGKITIRSNILSKFSVNLTIPQLEILDDLDFFELPPETLSGFRDAIKGAIENMARKMLVNGLDLNVLGKRLAKYGINDLHLQLFAEGLILMQADIDVYKLIFEDESLDRGLIQPG